MQSPPSELKKSSTAEKRAKSLEVITASQPLPAQNIEEADEEEEEEEDERLLNPELLTPEIHIGDVKVHVNVPTTDFQSEMEQELKTIMKKEKKEKSADSKVTSSSSSASSKNVEAVRAVIKQEVGKMMEDLEALKGGRSTAATVKEPPQSGSEDSEEISDSQGSESESDVDSEEEEEEEEEETQKAGDQTEQRQPKDGADKILAKFAEKSLKKANDFELQQGSALNKPAIEKPNMPLPPLPPGASSPEKPTKKQRSFKESMKEV